MIIVCQQRNRGIALVIVLIVVIVLGLLAGRFAYLMKVETQLARNASNDPELEWMGRSGVELARYVLAQSAKGPNAQCDALNQTWAGGLGDTNDIVSQIPLKEYHLGRGVISIEIKDMDRKLNINTADKFILEQALSLVGVDGARFPPIVDSILDWIDRDDDTHLGGTESDFYRQLPVPYFAKNGPIDDISELLLINNISPAMYYGSGDGGSPATPVPRLRGRRLSDSAFDEPSYLIGLKDLFTPLSSGKINVNTASATVLQLLPEIDENVAASILTGPMGRAGPDGQDGTQDDTPFRSIGELARIPGMNPNALQLLNRYFAVRSAVFEVTVDVSLDSQRRRQIAVLQRGNNPQDAKVLYMYWD